MSKILSVSSDIGNNITICNSNNSNNNIYNADEDTSSNINKIKNTNADESTTFAPNGNVNYNFCRIKLYTFTYKFLLLDSLKRNGLTEIQNTLVFQIFQKFHFGKIQKFRHLVI